MSRGRESNHAHVVRDSHDHTEFELGDLTGEQAFAAAIGRDPEGQLSAHTVRERWEAARPSRTDARATDRKHREVATWWTKHERGLPPSMRTAIAGHQHQIIDMLVPLPNADARRQAVSTSAVTINWRETGAAFQFLDRLGRTAVASSSRGGEHTTAQIARYER